MPKNKEEDTSVLAAVASPTAKVKTEDFREVMEEKVKQNKKSLVRQQHMVEAPPQPTPLLAPQPKCKQ